MLIDSHCHLDAKELLPRLEDLRLRARRAGIVKILSAGVTIKDFSRLKTIAHNCEEVFCLVGIHPHYAHQEQNIMAAELIKLAQDPKVLGFGECGLDFYYQHASPLEQKAVFKQHLLAGQETGLPVVIHARDADEEIAEMVLNAYRRKSFKGLLHCFTSGLALAQSMLEIGFYISVSGIITFPKAEELRKTISQIPLDRLLIETDAPYLAPVPYRGKFNEPSYVKLVAEQLAKIKQVSFEEIARITNQNFMRLFEKCR